MEVDASRYAVGAVLLQRKEDGKKHPIGYYSATLNEAQRNYDIYDLELLAIVMALKNWRPLLAGSPHKIIIYSDHLNLQYWRLPQRISRRVAREVLELSEYDFEIRHLPGRLNGRADALSRRPGYDQGEDDNKDVVVLPDHVFVRAGATQRAPPMRKIIAQEEMEATDPIYAQDVMIRTLRVMGLVLPQYVATSYRFRLFPLFPLCVLLSRSSLIYDNTPLDLFQLCLVMSRFVVSAL